ncbi:hypothetical protein Q8A64_05630 [Oxalobacteraceae bacterium R-40]|uniref:Uncharacterized protein n=1 Tax=Keguizhuia sedimenti TaxID=3064264 RepID=A0ABU1BLZ5_9BURK|nr:hypothetical protein [Oxalobacteraceae bacterium R-40]
MADKKQVSPSSGPRTRAGKAASSLNAMKHGMRSSRLLLPHENPDDYDALLHDLDLDLRPVGAIENLLVENIAGVLWRKQRIDGAEQALITVAQMIPFTDAEMKEALGLNQTGTPYWMWEESELGSIFPPQEKPLPGWMSDEKNAPSQDEGAEAVVICTEWKRFRAQDSECNSAQQAQHAFPVHWEKLKEEMAASPDGNDPLFYLQHHYGGSDFAQGFAAYLLDQQKKYYWIAYWHQNRDEMTAAFRAIRIRRMLSAWEPERSHRYSTMLDNQLFKLLREFRDMQAWRLSHLDLTDDATSFSTH